MIVMVMVLVVVVIVVIGDCDGDGASGGGDGALKKALHCSANSEHCILRRTGGNRCACQ